jgi:anti-sigma factor RsiW
LLGEATASEREAFEAHAAACARCAEDAAAFFPLRETVERASADGAGRSATLQLSTAVRSPCGAGDAFSQ